MPPAPRRHESGEGVGRIRREHQERHPLAWLPVVGTGRRRRGGLLQRLEHVREDVPDCRGADPARTGLLLQPHAGGVEGLPGRAGEAGPPLALPRHRSRTQPAHLSRDARWQVRRRRVVSAGEDRHGLAQHPLPRPRPLPHPPRRALPLGQCVVRVPDVRLRASDRGRAGGRDALDVYAGVRGPPSALRLGGGPHGRAGAAHGAQRREDPSAPARVRAPQHHLDRDVEAPPAAARHREARLRLGRPPHADRVRHAPPGFPARRDPRVLRACGRDEDRERERPRAA